MNTASDQLDEQNLLNLLKQAEPSWKTNRIPLDPATELFRKPPEPRRADFRFDAPFGSVQATGAGSSSGNSNVLQNTVTIAAPVQSGGFYTSELVDVVGIVQ